MGDVNIKGDFEERNELKGKQYFFAKEEINKGEEGSLYAGRMDNMFVIGILFFIYDRYPDCFDKFIENIALKKIQDLIDMENMPKDKSKLN